MSFFEKWVGSLPRRVSPSATIPEFRHSHKELFNTFYLSIMATVLAALLGSLVAYITERKKPKGQSLAGYVDHDAVQLSGPWFRSLFCRAFSGNSIIKLTGTYTIIVISYMVRRTPYVYRSVAASLAAQPFA